MRDSQKDTHAPATAEPFLKWAGGKRRLLPEIVKHLPALNEDGHYFEPFLGAGAVFFGLGPSRAVLSDLNEELVETFVAVRDEIEDVIESLESLEHNEETYYKVRSSRPRLLARKAARFIYLNKTCFNGLYRVNQKGQFNVPFGQHTSALLICDKVQLRNASVALQAAERLTCEDFQAVAESATLGDLVYCDPPYTTAHRNNGFIEYNARVFAWDDQRRLAELSKQLNQSGIAIAVSNADHPSIQELYPRTEFRSHRIRRQSTMAGNGARRFATTELLLIGRGAEKGGGW